MFKFDDPSSQVDNFGTTRPFAELIGEFACVVTKSHDRDVVRSHNQAGHVLISRVAVGIRTFADADGCRAGAIRRPGPSTRSTRLPDRFGRSPEPHTDGPQAKNGLKDRRGRWIGQ